MTMMYYNQAGYQTELYHFGVKGMKWGVRRYQNADGSLTKAGTRRYGDKTPYEVRTSDGDTFRVSRGSKKNYNRKNSKVTKTWGQHNKEVDDAVSKRIEAKKNTKLAKRTEHDMRKLEDTVKKGGTAIQKHLDYIEKHRSGNLVIYNRKLLANATKYSRAVDKMVVKMSKKYDTVMAIPEKDIRTGEMYVDIALNDTKQSR